LQKILPAAFRPPLRFNASPASSPTTSVPPITSRRSTAASTSSGRCRGPGNGRRRHGSGVPPPGRLPPCASRARAGWSPCPSWPAPSSAMDADAILLTEGAMKGVGVSRGVYRQQPATPRPSPTRPAPAQR